MSGTLEDGIGSGTIVLTPLVDSSVPTATLETLPETNFKDDMAPESPGSTLGGRMVGLML